MLHILLDTGIGNDMDDMQALAYLLAQPDADILGITTVTGEAIARRAGRHDAASGRTIGRSRSRRL